MKSPRQMITLLLAATVFLFTQCGSDDPAAVKPQNVYVAGSFNTGTTVVPAYWKNGELVKLSELSGEAAAIAVKGDDVYVIGNLNDENPLGKKLWKNGEVTDFTDGSTSVYIYALRIVGDDLYAAGMVSTPDGQGHLATYWKNGVAHTVAPETNSRAYDITVVGNDVYVAGLQYNEDNKGVAKYWKNDVGTELSDGTAHADASGIAVVNNDVYVSGSDNDRLTLWKNGVATLLGGAQYASGTSTGGLVIHDNNVYVVGYESNGTDYKAKYWKNGTAFTLPTPAAATKSVFGYSAAVAGNDIYFLGEFTASTSTNTNPGIVWKNFKMMAPYDGTSVSPAYFIAIAP